MEAHLFRSHFFGNADKNSRYAFIWTIISYLEEYNNSKFPAIEPFTLYKIFFLVARDVRLPLYNPEVKQPRVILNNYSTDFWQLEKKGFISASIDDDSNVQIELQDKGRDFFDNGGGLDALRRLIRTIVEPLPILYQDEGKIQSLIEKKMQKIRKKAEKYFPYNSLQLGYEISRDPFWNYEDLMKFSDSSEFHINKRRLKVELEFDLELCSSVLNYLLDRQEGYRTYFLIDFSELFRYLNADTPFLNMNDLVLLPFTYHFIQENCEMQKRGKRNRDYFYFPFAYIDEFMFTMRRIFTSYDGIQFQEMKKTISKIDHISTRAQTYQDFNEIINYLHEFRLIFGEDREILFKIHNRIKSLFLSRVENEKPAILTHPEEWSEILEKGLKKVLREELIKMRGVQRKKVCDNDAEAIANLIGLNSLEKNLEKKRRFRFFTSSQSIYRVIKRFEPLLTYHLKNYLSTKGGNHEAELLYSPLSYLCNTDFIIMLQYLKDRYGPNLNRQIQIIETYRKNIQYMLGEIPSIAPNEIIIPKDDRFTVFYDVFQHYLNFVLTVRNYDREIRELFFIKEKSRKREELENIDELFENREVFEKRRREIVEEFKSLFDTLSGLFLYVSPQLRKIFTIPYIKLENEDFGKIWEEMLHPVNNIEEIFKLIQDWIQQPNEKQDFIKKVREAKQFMEKSPIQQETYGDRLAKIEKFLQSFL